MGKRFRVLQFIGSLLKIIGMIELLIAVSSLVLAPLIITGSDNLLLQFGYAPSGPGSNLLIGFLIGVLVFIGGLAVGLFTFAAGELFNLLISVEENTRTIILNFQK